VEGTRGVYAVQFSTFSCGTRPNSPAADAGVMPRGRVRKIERGDVGMKRGEGGFVCLLSWENLHAIEQFGLRDDGNGDVIDGWSLSFKI
jgi:hypothetical protein